MAGRPRLGHIHYLMYCLPDLVAGDVELELDHGQLWNLLYQLGGSKVGNFSFTVINMTSLRHTEQNVQKSW